MAVTATCPSDCFTGLPQAGQGWATLVRLRTNLRSRFSLHHGQFAAIIYNHTLTTTKPLWHLLLSIANKLL